MGTQWQKDIIIIIKLDKDKEDLKTELHNLRREVDDKALGWKIRRG